MPDTPKALVVVDNAKSAPGVVPGAGFTCTRWVIEVRPTADTIDE